MKFWLTGISNHGFDIFCPQCSNRADLVIRVREEGGYFKICKCNSCSFVDDTDFGDN